MLIFEYFFNNFVETALFISSKMNKEFLTFKNLSPAFD